MNIVVLTICGAMITAGAVFAFIRLERGPSMLDRVVALDVITAAVLATVALISAHTGRGDLVPVLVVLALVGFLGSVTIARFAATESDDERRILSRAEARALEEQQRRRDLEEAESEHQRSWATGQGETGAAGAGGSGGAGAAGATGAASTAGGAAASTAGAAGVAGGGATGAASPGVRPADPAAPQREERF